MSSPALLYVSSEYHNFTRVLWVVTLVTYNSTCTKKKDKLNTIEQWISLSWCDNCFEKTCTRFLVNVILYLCVGLLYNRKWSKPALGLKPSMKRTLIELGVKAYLTGRFADCLDNHSFIKLITDATKGNNVLVLITNNDSPINMPQVTLVSVCMYVEGNIRSAISRQNWWMIPLYKKAVIKTHDNFNYSLLIQEDHPAS